MGSLNHWLQKVNYFLSCVILNRPIARREWFYGIAFSEVLKSCRLRQTSWKCVIMLVVIITFTRDAFLVFNLALRQMLRCGNQSGYRVYLPLTYTSSLFVPRVLRTYKLTKFPIWKKRNNKQSVLWLYLFKLINFNILCSWERTQNFSQPINL